MKTLATLTILGTLAFATPASASKCHEDQGCWSWSTMGNHKRGLAGHTVGPCGYSRLIRQGVQGKHLKGDRWALKHGCIGNVQNW